MVEPWHPWSGVKQLYDLQFWDGKAWKTIIARTTEGTGITERFDSVNAQKFRLILENQKEAPALGEFILFRSE